MPADDFNDHQLLTIARRIVLARRREVSVALLQQWLNIGPVRARSLLDQMELDGEVKPTMPRPGRRGGLDLQHRQYQGRRERRQTQRQ